MSSNVDSRTLIQGDPFGLISPKRPPQPLPSVDGRTVALRILRDYISRLEFFRPGDRGGPPIPYRIKTDDIHIEQPDNMKDLVFPSIVFRPGDVDYASIGLTSYLDESSADRYGKGLVVQEQAEFTEVFVIEVWASKKPERRSIVAGLEVALVPTEQMFGIRFRMPDYFDRTVCFSLFSSQRPDDPEVVRNKRWAYLSVEMRFNVSRLVSYVPLDPSVQVEAYEPLTVPLGVDFDSDPTAPDEG